MRVVIGSNVFAAASADPLALIALCDLGFEGRHRIQVDDESDPRFQKWMAVLPDDQREACRTAFDAGLEEDAREPSRFEIHVIAEPLSDWGARPPRLTRRDALAFLQTPFSILVEDKVSDRGFLLAMATLEQRRWLESRECQRWLCFEHGGGLGTMLRDIPGHKGKPLPDARVFVLFDSDALRPGVPNSQSESLRICCEQPPRLSHHQLQRRASENYLPRQIVKKHAETPNPQQAKRFACFRAFERLRDEQRFHYNMKTGLRGDESNQNADAGDLYANLSIPDRESLREGFGKKIGALFHSERIDEHLLKSDGGWFEMNQVVCSIIAMLR